MLTPPHRMVPQPPQAKLAGSLAVPNGGFPGTIIDAPGLGSTILESRYRFHVYPLIAARSFHIRAMFETINPSGSEDRAAPTHHRVLTSRSVAATVGVTA